MLEVRRSRERGFTDNGWLKTFHSFAFADYFDPEHVEFGPLRVVNEDRVKPGKAFGPHAAAEMEILTFIVQGEIERTSSLGKSAILRVGDVQHISAGTGLEHRETNLSATQEAHLLQIWVRPAKPGLAPSIETRHFASEDKAGRLKLIASATGEAGSLRIQQDVCVYASALERGQRLEFEVGRARCAYIHIARGSVEVGETRLNVGDAMKITQVSRIALQNGSGAEVILMNLPGTTLNAVFHRPRVRYVRPTPAPPRAAAKAEQTVGQPHTKPKAKSKPESQEGLARKQIPERPPERAAQSTAQPARRINRRNAGSSARSGPRAGRRTTTSGK